MALEKGRGGGTGGDEDEDELELTMEDGILVGLCPGPIGAVCR